MHNYVFVDIADQRIEYPLPEEQEFLTLEEYYEIARRMIIKHVKNLDAQKNMLNSDDAIAYVAHKLMMGDWRFKSKDDEKWTRRGYLGQCGRWAISEYMKKIVNNKNRCFYTIFDTSDNDENYSLATIIADENNHDTLENGDYTLEKKEYLFQIKELVDVIFQSDILSEKESRRIKMRFLDNMSIKDIAASESTSYESIRQTIEESMNKIQKCSYLNEMMETLLKV